MSETYAGYGIRIRSDLPLTLCRDDGEPDLTLERSADRTVPDEDPSGRPIGLHVLGDRTLYRVADDGGRLTIRFPGILEVTISGRYGSVTIDPDTARGLDAMLLEGAALALWLSYTGRFVLHASAVVDEGRALAFAGPVGTGKSTLAASCCTSGARLLTDDTLRVEENQAFPGGTAVRLRTGARELAAHMPGRVAETADGRLAVVEPDPPRAPAQLAGIVLPVPDRLATEVDAQRLTRAKALTGLVSCSRVAGWIDPRVAEREFRSLARLARDVPVWRARIPWGPPFSAQAAKDLLELAQDDAVAAPTERVS